MYKKKLIEVAIPLEAINAASAREKSIRHGHPSTLHLWWARRPLAACRAVLFAQLVDDPSSLPDQFPTQELQDAERKRLFAIIEDLVKWENSTNEEVLERARAEIRRSCGGVLPPIYDPFSGGGSIPLEAQRLGLPAYGSDLNPVAVMIGKSMIEIPPKFKDHGPIHPGIKERNHYRNAEGLAEDVKYYGQWMCQKAWERIGHLYPQVELPNEYGGGKATVIAWIWSRTVPSPDPAFAEVQVPISSSFLINSKPGKEVWVEPIVDRHAKTIAYQIRHGGTRAEIEKAGEGTKASRGANFHCIISGTAISPEYVKEKGRAREISQTLIAIIVQADRGKFYLAPEVSQVTAADLPKTTERSGQRLPNHSQYNGVAPYGFEFFSDLYTERQYLVLSTLSTLVEEAALQATKDFHALENVSTLSNNAVQYGNAISAYLAFAVDKIADRNSQLVTWANNREHVTNAFKRQAISMTWDFSEINPFSTSSGNFLGGVRTIFLDLEQLQMPSQGSIIQKNAIHGEYRGRVISTDPPYYDNVPYADISDYFYIWMRKSLSGRYPELFSTVAVPKQEELVADRVRHGSKLSADQFFLSGMKQVMLKIAEDAEPGYPATIYYAFKQSDTGEDGVSSAGWVAFVDAIIGADLTISGTWPVRTELARRMRSLGSNALANSVVLVCRKKDSSAETVTRAEFIRALKRELPDAIKELQAANIAPADMPQSAIGPGMGVFSRYRAVLESDDSPMCVKAALQLINRELDDYLGGIQGEFDADTRFAITWFEQNGLKAGDYGTANNIATARGISVESVKHAGIVESQAGKVRILRRDELNDNWEPGTDQHLTIWECLQHLVRLNEKDGISLSTAILLRKIGDKADAVKDLAYILYDISANKRQDAKEATAYNALIADWTELSRQAASNLDTVGDRQQRLDL